MKKYSQEQSHGATKKSLLVGFLLFFAMQSPLAAQISPKLEHNVRIYELIDYMWTPMTVSLQEGWGMSLYELAKRFIQEKFGCSPEELLEKDDLATLNDDEFRSFLIELLNQTLQTIAIELKRDVHIASVETQNREMVLLLDRINYLDTNLHHSLEHSTHKIKLVRERIANPAHFYPRLLDTYHAPKGIEQLCCNKEGTMIIARCPSHTENEHIGPKIYFIARDPDRRWQQRYEIDMEAASIALSADGKILALGRYDGSVELRTEDASGQWHPITVLPAIQASAIEALCFSPRRSSLLLTGDTNGTIYAWRKDLDGPWTHQVVSDTGSSVTTIQAHPTENIFMVTLIPSRALLIREDDQQALNIEAVFDLEVFVNLFGAFAPQSNQVVFCTEDQGWLWIYQPENPNRFQPKIPWRLQKEPDLTPLTNNYRCILWTPFYLFFGMNNGTICFMQIAPDGKYRMRHSRLKAHGKAVTTLCGSADGRILFSGSNDHTIRIWDCTPPAHTVQQALFLWRLTHAHSHALRKTAYLESIWNEFDTKTQQDLLEQFPRALANFSKLGA